MAMRSLLLYRSSILRVSSHTFWSRLYIPLNTSLYSFLQVIGFLLYPLYSWYMEAIAGPYSHASIFSGNSFFLFRTSDSAWAKYSVFCSRRVSIFDRFLVQGREVPLQEWAHYWASASYTVSVSWICLFDNVDFTVSLLHSLILCRLSLQWSNVSCGDHMFYC